MGIWSRIIRICKADLHGVMDHIEDRDLLLKQHLREMQAAMAAGQARIGQLEEAARTAQRHLAGYDQQLQAVEGDLDRAVIRDKDDIARLLIRKRRSLEQCAENLENRIRDLTGALADARERLAVQTMTYDALRLRAAAVQERSRRTLALAGPLDGETLPGPLEASAEEVDWELLQRKEALASGRAR
jgi:phage shock protein A